HCRWGTLAVFPSQEDLMSTTNTTTDLDRVRASDDVAVRPFPIEIPEAACDDLRRRLEQTRWPEKETVTDESQGIQLVTISELARYWRNDYDFTRLETRLKVFPHLVTKIDAVDIHFIHVKSRHEDALPLIITHGWPGSIVEMLNVIGPLTDP